MLNRINQMNKYNREIKFVKKSNENNTKSNFNNNNNNTHMSLMLLQSNSNQKYPMWTHSSHRATWPMVMPRIILEFKAKKCWDYVDPDNTPNNENGEIPENSFQEEEINVADRVAQEEQALLLVYEQQYQSTEEFLVNSHNLDQNNLRILVIALIR